MNAERRSRNPRSAAVSAEDQPQRPRKFAGTRWNPRRPWRSTCCGWCSAHTAALREESSRRARILMSCSTERKTERDRSPAAQRAARTQPRAERSDALGHSPHANQRPERARETPFRSIASVCSRTSSRPDPSRAPSGRYHPFAPVHQGIVLTHSALDWVLAALWAAQQATVTCRTPAGRLHSKLCL